MRLGDLDELKKKINSFYDSLFVGCVSSDLITFASGVDGIINNAPTVEPRIEYGTDGQPYRLFMSGGQVEPDILQGWRYEERTQGEWIPSEEQQEAKA